MRGTGIIKAVRKRPLKRTDLPFILGEYFYQLRAALDGLAYKAITLITQNEPTTDNKLDFPIKRSPAELQKSSLFNNYPIPDELREWLSLVQPYNAANTMGTQYQGINGAFDLLNDCARKDRHRKLHIVGAVVTNAQGSFGGKGIGRLDWVTLLPCNLLESESVVMEFGFSGVLAEAELNLNGELSIDIAVGEMEGVVGAELGKAVFACQAAVMFAIQFFEECSFAK